MKTMNIYLTHHIDFCLREASWNKDFAKIYNGKKFSDFKN